MEKDLLQYVLDQASGILIALLLIVRVEKRLDQLVKSFEEFTARVINEMRRGNQ